MSRPNEENPLTPAERELESALGALAPAPPPDQRLDIAFSAGRAAGRRAALPWRLTSGLLLAALAFSLAFPRSPRFVDRYVTLPAPTAPPVPAIAAIPALPAPRPIPTPLLSSPETPIIADASYASLRQTILTAGVDSLPSPRPLATPRDTLPSLRRPAAPLIPFTAPRPANGGTL